MDSIAWKVPHTQTLGGRHCLGGLLKICPESALP